MGCYKQPFLSEEKMVEEFRIIIAGGRDFNNYLFLKEKMDHCVKHLDKDKIVIICGECSGADTLGKQWAEENNYTLVKMPANWNRFKKPAGHIRNARMADYATHLVAFWDGVSPGTKGMVDLAKKKRLNYRVYNYENC